MGHLRLRRVVGGLVTAFEMTGGNIGSTRLCGCSIIATRELPLKRSPAIVTDPAISPPPPDGMYITKAEILAEYDGFSLPKKLPRQQAHNVPPLVEN